jgi:hypothetical protein
MDDTRLADELARLARKVVRSEINSYDQLSRTSKIRYEHKLGATEPTPLDLGVYKCAHGQWLYKVCAMCGRGPDEAMVYVRAMRSRVEELVSILEGKS